LADGNLEIENINLEAAGYSSAKEGPNTDGLAGIWVAGSVEISDAVVYASGQSYVSHADNFPTEGGPAFGIFALNGPIEINYDSDVEAYAEQDGTPKGGRAAGIFCRHGDIVIDGAKKVYANAASESATAAGIYSEYGNVKIFSMPFQDKSVVAVGDSVSGGTNEENRGIGIAAGVNVEIRDAQVHASGKSANGESTGIAASVPASDNQSPSGKVEIKTGSRVWAGAENQPLAEKKGHGIVIANGDGSVAVASGAVVWAYGQGDGFAIYADGINNEGTLLLDADDDAHYYRNGTTVTGSGTIIKGDENQAGGVSGSDSGPAGGCDAGFGGIAALFALVMLRVIRGKRA
jgi:hypothetical protein